MTQMRLFYSSKVLSQTHFHYSRVIDCDDARTTVPAASYGVTVATAVGQAPRQPAAGQVGQLGVRPDVLPPPGKHFFFQCLQQTQSAPRCHGFRIVA